MFLEKKQLECCYHAVLCCKPLFPAMFRELPRKVHGACILHFDFSCSAQDINLSTHRSATSKQFSFCPQSIVEYSITGDFIRVD